MYIINEQYTPTRTGGKGECRVFMVQIDGTLLEITEFLAKEHGRKLNKINNIVINYGSGTGFMVISTEIRKKDKDCFVYNVSIF